jgi:hypothetical protein
MRKRLSPDELGELLVLPQVAVLATDRRDGTVLIREHRKASVLMCGRTG